MSVSPDDTESGARRAILAATRRLLETPGALPVSLEGIAAEAGYSRQAIYRHFGSRAGLLRATLADIDVQAGAEDAVAEVLTADDPAVAIDALIAWWADHVAGFAGVARAVYAGRTADPELAAAWDDRMDALLDVCRQVIARCAEAGALRPELSRPAAAEMLWGMLSIPLWDQLVVDRGWSRATYKRRIGWIARASLTVG
jgi:AcrR family transcriptional regulator